MFSAFPPSHYYLRSIFFSMKPTLNAKQSLPRGDGAAEVIGPPSLSHLRSPRLTINPTFRLLSANHDQFHSKGSTLGQPHTTLGNAQTALCSLTLHAPGIRTSSFAHKVVEYSAAGHRSPGRKDDGTSEILPSILARSASMLLTDCVNDGAEPVVLPR